MRAGSRPRAKTSYWSRAQPRDCVEICNEIGREHKIVAQHVALDLSQRDAPLMLFEETNRRGIEVETLINNAGFGSFGDFLAQGLERELNMIDLNVTSLVALTHLYLGPRARAGGAIINVASVAGFQPVPYMTTYAATKAFVLSFSEALWEENRRYGIEVMALCPGTTETNFFAAAQSKRPPGRVVQTPEQVVDAALRGLKSRQSTVVSGWSNMLVTSLGKFLPRSFVAARRWQSNEFI
ncbi:MAG: SDR family oxidoreductase [Pyrinomonadaceae bacterium]